MYSSLRRQCYILLLLTLLLLSLKTLVLDLKVVYQLLGFVQLVLQTGHKILIVVFDTDGVLFFQLIKVILEYSLFLALNVE